MGEAGYRDTSGNWLARPSQPLGSYRQPHRYGQEKEREEGEGEDAAPGGVAMEKSGGLDGSGGGLGASVLFVRESKLIQVWLHPPPATPP